MTWKTPVLLAALLAAVPAAGAYPKNCLEVQMSNLRAFDGDYIIEPTPGRVFTVYCRGMANWAPVEYLTLVNTGGDYNFGQYTAGGAAPGTNVRTSFTKVRIDPSTLLVDIGDLTYATSTGLVTHAAGGAVTKAPYAVALDCAGYRAETGLSNIDLTGTPFQASQVFFAHGYNPGGSVSVDGAPAVPLAAGYPSNGAADVLVTGKTLTLHGGGYCGSAGPRGINSAHGRWLGPSAGMFALQLVYVGE